jgi:hypothetical protein
MTRKPCRGSLEESPELSVGKLNETAAQRFAEAESAYVIHLQRRRWLVWFQSPGKFLEQL